MNERGTYLEEYRVLSPKERNMHYRKFWGALPFDAYRDVARKREFEEMDPVIRPQGIKFDNPSDIQSRREKSELLPLMLKKLEALLSFAPITPSFKQFILDGYQVCYTMGVEEGVEGTYAVSPTGETLLWSLDPDYPEHAGIFDPERAKDLERIGYRQELNAHFWVQGFIQLSCDKMGIKLDSERHHEIHGDSKHEGILKQWRSEFIEKYTDEP